MVVHPVSAILGDIDNHAFVNQFYSISKKLLFSSALYDSFVTIEESQIE